MATATRRFELDGDGVRITYATSSFAGPPQFAYADKAGARRFFGDEIESVPTALGTEVTVVLESVADLRTITLTLLLPPIEVPIGGVVEFDTLAVRSTHATTIGGPPLGASQTYVALRLHGTARAADP